MGTWLSSRLIWVLRYLYAKCLRKITSSCGFWKKDCSIWSHQHIINTELIRYFRNEGFLTYGTTSHESHRVGRRMFLHALDSWGQLLFCTDWQTTVARTTNYVSPTNLSSVKSTSASGWTYDICDGACANHVLCDDEHSGRCSKYMSASNNLVNLSTTSCNVPPWITSKFSGFVWKRVRTRYETNLCTTWYLIRI